jgi:hypothetical protein
MSRISERNGSATIAPYLRGARAHTQRCQRDMSSAKLTLAFIQEEKSVSVATCILDLDTSLRTNFASAESRAADIKQMLVKRTNCSSRTVTFLRQASETCSHFRIVLHAYRVVVDAQHLSSG